MTRHGAIAVDLGASSIRFAKGWIKDDKIQYEVLAQHPNQPTEQDGLLTWDIDRLLAFTREAVQAAGEMFDEATVGIDSWGVDHGFVNKNGLVQPVVCYRDRSHESVFECMGSLRARLYELTGIQHQPFNTFYQLIARRLEKPELAHTSQWLILPDLLAYLLTGESNYESTQCSTTQLTGLDGSWCAEAFDLAGWPVPSLQPSMPGRLIEVGPHVQLAYVGSHDTASAVFGLGSLDPDQAFLNVGTWSLLGCMLDKPLVTSDAEEAGFTNERAVDGKVRFLANIPGFYVISRLREELCVHQSVADWIGQAGDWPESVNLLDPIFFNPPSMMEAFADKLSVLPSSSQEWISVIVQSLCATTSSQCKKLESVTGRKFQSLRVSGGGSASPEFCRALAKRTRKKVIVGPAEATLMGNLAFQFAASGAVLNLCVATDLIRNSVDLNTYEPSAEDGLG